MMAGFGQSGVGRSFVNLKFINRDGSAALSIYMPASQLDCSQI